MPPREGQRSSPLKDWRRFLRVADWFERTVEHGKGVLRPVYGNGVIVKTPAAGIAAREGTDLYSATCTLCAIAETSTAGQRLIHETDTEIVVYNSYLYAIAGSLYVTTGLTEGGRITEGPCQPVARFKQ